MNLQTYTHTHSHTPHTIHHTHYMPHARTTHGSTTRKCACICCCSTNFPSFKPHPSVILLPAALPQTMKRPSTERMMLFVANGRLHTTAQNPLVLVRRRAPVTCALCPVTCVAHGLSFALATPKSTATRFVKTSANCHAGCKASVSGRWTVHPPFPCLQWQIWL